MASTKQRELSPLPLSEDSTFKLVIVFVTVLLIGFFALSVRNDIIRNDIYKDCYQLTNGQVACPKEIIEKI